MRPFKHLFPLILVAMSLFLYQCDSQEDFLDDIDLTDAQLGKGGKGGNGGKGSSGSTKGDLFGDMYALLRDDINGIPLFSEEGFVQPIDEFGDAIPLDEDGHPLDEEAAMEVELGRLNVGRSPSHVLERRLEEAVGIIEQADAIWLDAPGRITFIKDGEIKTIDSPLENLALYLKLMNDGSLDLNLVTAVLPEELAFLNDGVLTIDDYPFAASFFAAASDKYVPLGIDNIIYINTILKIQGTLSSPFDNVQYVDYSQFNYDREHKYGQLFVDVMVETDPGKWEVQSVHVYTHLFGGNNAHHGGVAAFTEATDDARQVLAFVHDFTPPEDE